jgi:glycosyltransferase involved in cell wall biosynthesis
MSLNSYFAPAGMISNKKLGMAKISDVRSAEELLDFNCIFLSEALRPRSGGIGRYAKELLLHLMHDQTLKSVRCLDAGRLIDVATVLASYEVASAERAKAPYIPPIRLRSQLGRIKLLGMAYEYLREARGRATLRNVGDLNTVVHGPSFFAPISRFPTVVTIHDLSVYFFPESHPATRVERVKKMILTAIDREFSIIVDSDATKRELEGDFKAPLSLVSVVPLGVDQSFQPRAPEVLEALLVRYGLRAENYLLCVATLEPRKNIGRLIQAYATYPLAKRLACPLVLVGAKGWKESPLMVQIRGGESEGWIKLLGEVSEVDLPYVFSGAKAFAYMSLYEGFGLPVLEAMASGVPVLCSNTSAMPEVGGDTCLMVDPLDVDAIAFGLEKVLGDESWRSEAISAALLRASHFTWNRVASQTLDVYRSAIKNHS